MNFAQSATWCGQIEQLALDGLGASADQAATYVQRTADLIEAAPDHVKNAVRGNWSQEGITALLELEAFEGAAIALLGSLPYMLSRSPGGETVVTICVPGDEEELTCSASDTAIALCATLSLALLRLGAPPGWHKSHPSRAH